MLDIFIYISYTINMEEEKVHLLIPMTRKLRSRFKVECAMADVSMADVIRHFIDTACAGNVLIDAREVLKKRAG